MKRTAIQRRPAPGSRTSFAPPKAAGTGLQRRGIAAPARASAAYNGIKPAPLPYRVTKLPGKSRPRRGKPTPQRIRRRKDEAEHRAMSKRVRAEHPVCQVRRPFGCVGWPTDGHHILSRARGGPNEHWNYLAVCRHCHRFVHDNPKLAQEAGWMAKVGASSPWPREAA